MLGLNDKVGRLEVRGLGIRLNTKSTQKEFERALKNVPSLKGKQIIELTEKQVKDRELKSIKNGNKKENTSK